MAALTFHLKSAGCNGNMDPSGHLIVPPGEAIIFGETTLRETIFRDNFSLGQLHSGETVFRDNHSLG